MDFGILDDDKHEAFFFLRPRQGLSKRLSEGLSDAVPDRPAGANDVGRTRSILFWLAQRFLSLPIR